MKKPLTRIGIILIALLGIISALYQLFELYVLGSHSGEIKFSSITDPVVGGTIISVLTLIVSIGLLVHNKIARWIILLSNYVGLMYTLIMLVILFYLSVSQPEKSGEMSPVTFFMSLAVILLFALMIYLLSNQEALKLFNIQRDNNRREILLFSVFALIFSIIPFALTGLIGRLL